jgi:hypothetical protein
MMTPVCRTNDQWTAKFRLASDPTKYASQPYEIFVQREETVSGTPSSIAFRDLHELPYAYVQSCKRANLAPMYVGMRND